MPAPGLVAATTRSATPSPPRVGPHRHRWWLIAGGVVLVAGSLAGVQSYVTAQNQTVPVLVLAREVGWGRALTDGDLAVTGAVPDAHLRPVDAADRGQVLGHFAAHTLSAGVLLTGADLTTARMPGPGQLVVGVLLKPGAVPAKGVHPEDRVLLTPTVATTTTGATQAPPTTGTVLDAGTPAADGSLVVDVVVESSQVAIAGPAGGGQVVLSLCSPDGR